MSKIFDNYLENVSIKQEIKDRLIDYLKLKITNYNFDIPEYNLEYNKDNIFEKKWYKLTDNNKYKDNNIILYDKLKNIVNIEINSTAYMIKTISICILSIDPKIKSIILNFNDSIDKLTGLWDDDKKYFTINKMHETSTKLIMGLGPSASGKTFNAKTIIEIISKSNPDFPKTYITIDGGEYRKTSIIYNFIKNTVTLKGYAGLYELMSDEKELQIFKAGQIKDKIIDFIEKNKDKNISLYVPETCSSNCTDKIIKYIDITKSSPENKWIMLLIYQHKYSEDCNFSDNYKCVGCTKSGLQREIEEGKKYSNKSWDKSMTNAINIINMIDKNIGIYDRYIIHNSGNKDKKSILINLNDINLSKFIDNTKILYFDKNFYNLKKDNIYKIPKNTDKTQKYLKYKQKYMKLKQSLN